MNDRRALRSLVFTVLLLAACSEMPNDSVSGPDKFLAEVSLRKEGAAVKEVSVSPEAKNYSRTLFTLVGQALQYPPAAQRSGEQGHARVQVHFLRRGQLQQIELLQSTGWRDLDNEVKAVFIRIAGFPAVPDDVVPNAEPLIFTMPIDFSLSH